jgi:hypothetical protein
MYNWLFQLFGEGDVIMKDIRSPFVLPSLYQEIYVHNTASSTARWTGYYLHQRDFRGAPRPRDLTASRLSMPTVWGVITCYS